MPRARTYRVKELAELARISVRTLHHYDELGLLVPSERTTSGYRLYSEADVFRLQQILLGRELGLSLEEIRRSLDEPSFDRRSALRQQRRQLEQRAEQTQAMLGAVDAALAAIEAEDKASDTRLQRIFDGFEPSRYEAEAEQRWGHTDAYQESVRRTRRYTPEDWQRQAAEQAAIYGDAFQALQAGKAPDDPAAQAVAERHRLAIDRWFYPCSHAHHVRLADMYQQDPRFSASIEKFGPGLSAFLAESIRANAQRHGA